MISFVIRTKNEEDKIRNVLESIRSQVTSEDIEIIIVDSGSTDSTLVIAKEYDCNIINISPDQFTWGYALNVGINNAKGDIIGIISGHCILMNGSCVEKIIATFKKDRSISALYGRQVGVLQDDPFEKNANEKYYPIVEGVHYINQETKYSSTISNACCFLKKKVWENIKFDEIVQSCEDAKWAKETINKGLTIAYFSDVGVIHSHRLNFEYLYKKSYWREYEMRKIRNENHNRIYLFVKFMIKHLMSDFLSWRKILPIEVKSNTIFSYCYITNFACYKASISEDDNDKYEDIDVPSKIRRIGVYL